MSGAIVPGGWLLGVRRKPAADMGGKLLRIEYGVVHWTGGVGFNGAEGTLTAKDDKYVSAHMLFGRAGEMAQLVPFSRVAYHAGVSSWEGKTGLNTCSIGCELVNPGYYRAGMPVEWPMRQLRHRNGGELLDFYEYPEPQLAALERFMILMRDEIGLRKWVGHDHIAPGRKPDPGPAFPWGRFAAIPGILCPKK